MSYILVIRFLGFQPLNTLSLPEGLSTDCMIFEIADVSFPDRRLHLISISSSGLMNSRNVMVCLCYRQQKKHVTKETDLEKHKLKTAVRVLNGSFPYAVHGRDSAIQQQAHLRTCCSLYPLEKLISACIISWRSKIPWWFCDPLHKLQCPLEARERKGGTWRQWKSLISAFAPTGRLPVAVGAQLGRRLAAA